MSTHNPAAWQAAHTGVVAVVVTHHPDDAALARLLARLRPQVAHIVQIDNTDGVPATTLAPGAQLTVMRLGTNAGLGQAQNVGIEQARRLGATHVLLMDQDSLPPPGLIALQLRALAGPDASRVAAIGPLCRDIKTGQVMPLIQRRGWRIRRPVPARDAPPVPVAYMPASGSLIPMAMLDRVGTMRADYFIDRIDVEWCLRAGRMGLAVWVNPQAEMQHDQALRPVRLFGRTLYIGHPFRCYFHVRNSLAMALRGRIALSWRIDQVIKTPAQILLYCATAPTGRLRLARLLLTAVADGLRGRMGRGHYENRPFDR